MDLATKKTSPNIIGKIFNLFRNLVLISMFIVIGIVSYWYFIPITPITFEQPYPVINKEVKQGGYLEYIVKYCKNTNIIPEVSKTFVDGVLYTIQPAPAADNPTGCHERTVQQYIPKAIPPGKYHINIVYHYQMNPIRHIDVISDTEEFTILPNNK